MALDTTAGAFPGEMRELEGRCPDCGTKVRWTALCNGGRRIPPGTPYCEECAQRGRTPPRRPVTYDDPVLQSLHEAGVNVRGYAEMTLDSWDPTHDSHLERARRLVAQVLAGEGAGRGLYLHGTPGNGKTALSVAILRAVLEGGTPSSRVMFRLSRQFLRDMGQGYKTGQAADLVRSAKGKRLLVLDEFGKEPPTPHSAEVLSEILDQRAGATVITSNHSLGELGTRYAHVDAMEPLLSRLGPMNFAPLKFAGPDRRFQS